MGHSRPLFLSFQYSLKPHLNHPGKCQVTQGETLYKIGPNKFMGGGGVCGRGEKVGAFCSVCIFHNQKMHVYLILIFNNKIVCLVRKNKIFIE